MAILLFENTKRSAKVRKKKLNVAQKANAAAPLRASAALLISVTLRL